MKIPDLIAFLFVSRTLRSFVSCVLSAVLFSSSVNQVTLCFWLGNFHTGRKMLKVKRKICEEIVFLLHVCVSMLYVFFLKTIARHLLILMTFFSKQSLEKCRAHPAWRWDWNFLAYKILVWTFPECFCLPFRFATEWLPGRLPSPSHLRHTRCLPFTCGTRLGLVFAHA